jgi:hypothetical protein
MQDAYAALGAQLKQAAGELFKGDNIEIKDVKIARTRNTKGPGMEYWIGLYSDTSDPRFFEDDSGVYNYVAHKKNLMYKVWKDGSLEKVARPQVNDEDSVVFYLDVDCASDHVSGVYGFPADDYACEFHPISELGDGLLKECAQENGLPYYLQRGPKIIISPDVITPEIFKAIGEGPKSLVVFGAGAGTDAYMAEKLGYEDVTIVDLSSTVVDFHQKNFEGHFPRFRAVRLNAMDDSVADILSKPVDVAMLAVNYEVNPFFVRKFGSSLGNVGTLAVLPNLPNYYTEYGDALVKERWPFGPDSKLQNNFQHLADVWYHYERGLVASNDAAIASRVDGHFADAPKPEQLL